MNIDNRIKQLAKSNEHQSLFSISKELSNIKLFYNDTDLSRLQMIYISYLFYYYNIYMDIDMKKVSKRVLDNEIFEDAYSIWKKEGKEDNTSKPKKDISLVFSRSKKRKV